MRIVLVWLTFVSLLQTIEAGEIQENLEQYPIIETKNGLIQGSKLISYKGRMFYSFLGIPFAKPPVGDLRFKPPLPYGKWNGTLDGMGIKPFCTQVNIFGVDGDEDCLWLNVYTPKIKDANLPVAFFINPGGFLFGGGTFPRTTSPWEVMDHDIVFVTNNARLGVAGFLNTGDAVSPGNYHLLDNILTLKWIKENIADYGGNPDRVTLWGPSSGGIVALHLLSSPLTKGMIQGVIAQSGNPIINRMLSESNFYTQHLAELLRCPLDSSEEIVNCLRKKTSKELESTGLLKVAKQIFSFIGSPFPPRFLPTIDAVSGPEAVIPEHPLTLLQEGKFSRGVPVLIGISRDEACIYYDSMAADNPGFRTNFAEYFATFMEWFVNGERELSKDIFDFCFKDSDFNNETDFRNSFINCFSDSIYKASHDLTVRLLARYNPVYAYNFEYEDGIGDPCIGHCDELHYILNSMFMTRKAQAVGDKLKTLWINFIKFGNPTPDGFEPKWETVKPNSPKLDYLRIDQDLNMDSGYREKQFRFWQTKLYNFTLIEPDDK